MNEAAGEVGEDLAGCGGEGSVDVVCARGGWRWLRRVIVGVVGVGEVLVGWVGIGVVGGHGVIGDAVGELGVALFG